ncbi:hypothetical protein CC2G_007119 [Coprinopsis cinerea AmutBmut pab1-1]|nr:hypothetical protein CC2G_007119 [Coprinopsis cinerea AmutBmut pab1-1]
MGADSDTRLITLLVQAHVFEYFHVASVVLLFYDYLLTLHLEVQLIWQSRWCSVKVLYLLTRYLPFLDLTMLLIYLNVFGASAEACKPIYRFMTLWGITGFAIAEALLTIRIWPLWGDHPNAIKTFTGLLLTGTFATICVLTGQFMTDIKFNSELLKAQNVCVNMAPALRLRISWILVGVYDIVITVLLAIKALPAIYDTIKQAKPKSVSWVVYSDGLRFYVCLIALAFTNGSLPDDLIQLLSALHRVAISILACRAILHIRRRGQQEKEMLLPWQLSDFTFNHAF